MGLLFRKRFRLSKWLSLNVSKSGLGLSVGPPGAKVSINPKRARMQVGIPGTGIGYRRDVSMPQEGEPSAPSHRHTRAWLIVGLLLALLLVIALLSSCTSFPAWHDHALGDVAQGRWHVIPEQVPPSGSGLSPPIEFRDASGRNVGYGKVQGGSVEFFNSDSSWAGFGRIGR